LREILTPSLLFHSLEDDLTSFRSSKFILENLTASQKRLILLEDCYHLITVDKKKSEVIQETVAFLKGLIQNTVKNV
jgi:carboxylesterase